MIRNDSKEPKRVTYGEIAKGLNQGLEAADPLRLEGLTQLKRVRAAKGASLQREQARLSQKLGANHPRVAALSEKLEINSALERDVELGISRAQTPTVQPDANAWTLHGYVRNQERKGLANMTIGLYDDKGQWIEEGGHACTDANGYFRLTVKAEGSIKRGIDVKQAREAAAGVKPAAEAAAGAKPAETKSAFARVSNIDGSAPRGIFIHVTDPQGTTRYVDANSLSPKLGEVVYREIILDGDGCECLPPGGKPGSEKEGRYLGNRKSFELHDLNNTKPGCQLDEIKESQRESFTSQKAALAAGYDYCAHCFAKGKSKR